MHVSEAITILFGCSLPFAVFGIGPGIAYIAQRCMERAQ